MVDINKFAIASKYISCPKCNADPGKPCISVTWGTETQTLHNERLKHLRIDAVIHHEERMDEVINLVNKHEETIPIADRIFLIEIARSIIIRGGRMEEIKNAWLRRGKRL